MHKRNVTIGSLILVATGAVILTPLLEGEECETPETVEATPSARIQAARPVEAFSTRCDFHRGDEAAFEIRASTSVELEGVDADAIDEETTDLLEGVLSWEVAGTTDDGVTELHAALGEVSWDQEMSTPEERVEVDAIANKPFILRVDERCRFAGIGFTSEWKPEARRAVRDLLKSFEMVLPEQGSTARRWGAEQEDGVGVYKANYRLVRGPTDRVRIRRDKSFYKLDGAASDMGFRVQVLGALVDAEFDPSRPGWYRAIKGQEHLRLAIPGSPAMTFTNTIYLERADDRFSQVAAIEDADFTKEQLDTSVSSTPDANLTAMPWEVALENFRLHYADPGMHGASLALAEWLRANPQGAMLLLANLRAGLIEEEVRAGIFLALELAGTAESRQVLVEVLGDDAFGELDRARSAVALAQHGEPSAAAKQALLAQAGNQSSDMVRNTSMLGLGTLASRSEDTLHDELRGVLGEKLSQHAGESVEVIVVDAIGNSGDDSFGDALGARLHDDRTMMRSRAADALGKLSPEASRHHLVQRLAMETNPHVRARIARALGALGEQTLSDVELGVAARLLATSPSIGERAALIDWLTTSSDPRARAVVIEHFHREQDATLQVHIGKSISATELQGG